MARSYTITAASVMQVKFVISSPVHEWYFPRRRRTSYRPYCTNARLFWNI